MATKTTHVKNPLTIIAVFASITEISASAVLPHISEPIQWVFIWFIILFPFVLISLFFFILWNKHHVLYAPSDFLSDESFLSIVPQTSQDISEKINEETKESATVSNSTVNHKEIKKHEEQASSNFSFDIGAKEHFLISEELQLKKLKEKYGNKFKSQSTLYTGNIRFKVDGILQKQEKWELHEIKYFSSSNIPMNGIGKNIQIFKKFRDASPSNLEIIYYVHIVTPVENDAKEIIKNKFVDRFGTQKDIVLNLVDYRDLRKEFNLE